MPPVVLTTAVDRAVLKGTDFTARVAAICRDLPAGHPLPSLKHRRILIPGLVGGEFQFCYLGFTAHALRLRGAEVTALACDAVLPACTLRKVDHYECACTRWCHKNAGPLLRAARLPHRWYSGFLTSAEREEYVRVAAHVAAEQLGAFQWRGIDLGAHIPRSVESCFKAGRFDVHNPAMVAQGRELLAAAMCLTRIAERALEELEIEKVFLDDGMKIDWGVFRAVARSRGIPVNVLLGPPRGACVMIGRDAERGLAEPMPLWPAWRNVPLTPAQNAELDAYFVRRATRPYEDQQWAPTTPRDELDSIRAELGVPSGLGGLVFGMFPNLSYESSTNATSPTYPTAAEWVTETARFLRRWPQHHLVVKAHPAEQAMNAQDRVLDALTAAFGTLPVNVHVIPPETALTAHDVIRVLDVVMVYTSTVGLEAACLGKPVLNVAGGWHAARGFSIDVRTPADYFAVLTDICSGRLQPRPHQELARRYAYALFFRSALPVRHFTAVFPNVTALHIKGLEELAPGRDPTMDAVCRTILLDEPFYSEESLW